METDNDTLMRLMTVGRQLLQELDPDTVLAQILDEARIVTGARYAALGVLDEDHTSIDRFLTLGIDASTRRAIGDPPRGRGVLRVLIDDPRALRLADVGAHPHSFGFPPGHPPMGSFLGVPIVSRERAFGNLYLTEKEGGGEFTQADEDAVLVLAAFAGTAIENARRYQRAEHGRQELERAVNGLEAARSIADAIGAEPEIDRILELIVKRGRALVDARTVLILLKERDDLVVAAGAGMGGQQPGRRMPIAGSVCGRVLGSGLPQRIDDVPSQLAISHEALGLAGAATALLVPMTHRGLPIGLLMVLDRGERKEPFTAADEELMRGFAASAANAVALSRSVEADRLRSTIAAAEHERRRWARDLHDQTLQALGALRVLLAPAGRGESVPEPQRAIKLAVHDIDQEIASLRAIIADVRPSLLDDLGLTAALEALVDRRREDGLAITTRLNVPSSRGGGEPLSPELETTIYRLVQEALTNVVKHAGASAVTVRVELVHNAVEVEVVDDGGGFDAGSPSDGFGLTGMRERIYLTGGNIEIASGEAGTAVHASIPTDTDVAFGNLHMQHPAP